MEPERLLLIFERSADEPQLTGVSEAIRALGLNDVDVKVAVKPPVVDSLIGRAFRFWFPYVWSAGIIGVGPGAAIGPSAEVGELVITLPPLLAPTFDTVLGAWLQGRYGRKLRVKFHDVEIEAQTPEQVETLVVRLEALRHSRKATQAAKP